MRNLKWFILVICCLAIAKFIHKEFTGNFNANSIAYNPLYHSKLEATPLSADEEKWLDEVLNQEYFWLGRGLQVYAFGSADQKYVLKFFDFHRLKLAWGRDFFSHLPLIHHYYDYQEYKRVNRAARLFRGYETAYQYSKMNSGILFVHLNKSDNLKKQVVVVDRLGVSHLCDLDNTAFVIQERAVKTKDVFKELLANGDVEGVKKRIRNMFDLLVEDYHRGIFDSDHNVMYNMGFVGERPIRIDVGQLRIDESIKDPEVYKRDLLKISRKRLDKWFKASYAELRDELVQDIEAKLSEILGERVRLMQEDER